MSNNIVIHRCLKRIGFRPQKKKEKAVNTIYSMHPVSFEVSVRRKMSETKFLNNSVFFSLVLL